MLVFLGLWFGVLILIVCSDSAEQAHQSQTMRNTELNSFHLLDRSWQNKY